MIPCFIALDTLVADAGASACLLRLSWRLGVLLIACLSACRDRIANSNADLDSRLSDITFCIKITISFSKPTVVTSFVSWSSSALRCNLVGSSVLHCELRGSSSSSTCLRFFCLCFFAGGDVNRTDSDEVTGWSGYASKLIDEGGGTKEVVVERLLPCCGASSVSPVFAMTAADRFIFLERLLPIVELELLDCDMLVEVEDELLPSWRLCCCDIRRSELVVMCLHFKYKWDISPTWQNVSIKQRNPSPYWPVLGVRDWFHRAIIIN
jgi:hypothetical protein